MNRYQLAKLVDAATTLDSRKRMQKVVYMLQASGYELKADYFLHRYGPYSQDVANLTDEMVSQGLLEEIEYPTTMGGLGYRYQLTDTGREQIRAAEQKELGKRLAEEFASFEDRVKKLLKENLRELEVAATIVYFRKCGDDWSTAERKALDYKKVKSPDDASRMRKLAKQFVV